MSDIPECFYRVSVKALVWNETNDKFLITREQNDWWDLPGGGLDWGAEPREEVMRELEEEMGITPTWVADNPTYFVRGGQGKGGEGIWIVNVLYETELPHLDFTPSEECLEVRFVSKEDLIDIDVRPQIVELAEKIEKTAT